MRNPRKCFYCNEWIWLSRSLDGGWIKTNAEDGGKHICRKNTLSYEAKENRMLFS